jgi:hypothetical protein
VCPAALARDPEHPAARTALDGIFERSRGNARAAARCYRRALARYQPVPARNGPSAADVSPTDTGAGRLGGRGGGDGPAGRLRPRAAPRHRRDGNPGVRPAARRRARAGPARRAARAGVPAPFRGPPPPRRRRTARSRATAGLKTTTAVRKRGLSRGAGRFGRAGQRCWVRWRCCGRRRTAITTPQSPSTDGPSGPGRRRRPSASSGGTWPGSTTSATTAPPPARSCSAGPGRVPGSA